MQICRDSDYHKPLSHRLLCNVESEVVAAMGQIEPDASFSCLPEASLIIPSSSRMHGSLVCNNRNLRDVLDCLVPGSSVENRYAVSGEYDAENHVMYFDMRTVVINEYRQMAKKED